MTNVNDNKGYYVIYSLSMMNYLVRSGFDVVKVSDSTRNPKIKVFLFMDTPQLQETMKEFKR